MSLTSFFEERRDIARLLEDAIEPSLLNVYQTDLPKVLVVAVASSFERTVVQHIEDFYRSTSQHESATAFVLKKALFRQYHSLFDWNANNVTQFTNLFGPACTEKFKEELHLHDWLDDAVKDFLRLGRARNELVHGDFASYPVTLTPGEVQQKYESALRFVATLPQIIRVEAVKP